MRAELHVSSRANGRSPHRKASRAQTARVGQPMALFRRHDGRRSPAEAMAQWRASGGQLRERARKARRTAVLLAPFVVGVVLVNKYREQLFGLNEPVRLGCAVALVGLGAWFSRDAARAV